MKQIFIIHKNRPALLLFFAGWGMDEHPFRAYTPREKDFMVCYDYRTLDFDVSLLKEYTAIDVVGWSMGVWAASQILPTLSLPVRQSIAVNGTPFPIDEKRGIPPAIFQATLEGLNPSSLLKFQRRMCMNGSHYQRFLQMAPQRPVEELKEELAAIARQYSLLPATTFCWQRAFIGSSDRIFPPAHQQAAWEESSTDIELGNEAHYDEQLLSRYLQER